MKPIAILNTKGGSGRTTTAVQKRIAVINMKGGSGKTTTAVHLAAGLALRGHRTLLIDLDPQASATEWLPTVEELTESRPAHQTAQHPRLEHLLDPDSTVDLVDCLHAVEWCPEHLSLLPTSHHLDPLYSRLLPTPFGVYRLSERLEALQDYEYVLLDTPPQNQFALCLALAYAEHYLIPVTLHKLALRALEQTWETTRSIRGRIQPELNELFVVPYRADLRTRNARTLFAQLEAYEGINLAPFIHSTVRLDDAATEHLPVQFLEPDHPVTADYNHLTTLLEAC